MRRTHYPHQNAPFFMTEPTLHYVACDDAQGGHRMAYWQWGDALSARVVVCVHGLTRQGRDFDALAQAIVVRAGGNVRVVCPDVVGRGRSDWLRDPAFYQVPTYAADMVALIAQLQREQQPIDTLDWVGTSMGGLIGFVLAGHKELPLARPVRRFVPTTSARPSSRRRCSASVPMWARAAASSVQAGGRCDVGDLDQLRSAHAGAMAGAVAAWWCPIAASRWIGQGPMPATTARAHGCCTTTPPSPCALRAITPEAAAQGGAIMWSLYDAIEAARCVTRGAVSDLLSRDTALAMTQRGPHAALVEFEGVGHAPTFVDPAQIAAVTDFLFD
jgi:pimeloyl-ACP methyl ester carboxylesterase